MEKMVNFRPKPLSNPFGKISFSRLFELLDFFSLERQFLVLEHRKTHFPGLYCLKEKDEKLPILDKNHGLTLLKNLNFSTFSTFCFCSQERRFVVFRISFNTMGQGFS